jgi:hypothetical protein
MKLTRLYVDSKKKEHVEVKGETAEKIQELLQSQEDIASDDIEALLTASDTIAGANCHKTALFLSGDYSKEQLFAPDNDQPETAGHQDIESNSILYPDIEEFQEALAKRTFPYRVSFFKPKDGKPFAYHSITVLGVTNKDVVVAFEKAGPYADTPFRYVNGMDTIMVYLSDGYTPALETAKRPSST